MGLSAAFLVALERVDTWMLDTMRGPVEVAVYSAGVAFKPAFLAQSVVWAIMPLAFRLAKENPAQLVVAIRTTARYFVIGGVGLAIVFFSGGEVLVPLLAGGQYSQSIGVFRVLGLSLPFAFLGLLYLNSLTVVDRQMIAAGIVAAGLVVNAALDLVLVPGMGAEGAIVATLVTEVIMAVAAFVAVWRVIGKPFAVTDGRTLLAAGAAVAVACISYIAGVPDAGGLGVAALAVGLLVFKVVSKADVALFKSAIFVK
jgi:O-antigen/teichoic acid export membrane protein